ncbi:hypothetical protein ADL06_13635 [Streptomyces sp. NRRL F-6491]|nr:hypothetical protein ADL06_13635 [Streptomyces sp. NRRL F-6491]KOX41911.1 hypothetical protein ADL08_17705 [Streptomyces sp. NRRL F-6492]
MFGRPSALRVVDARWLGQAHDLVGADAADQLDGQAAQDPGQAGDVIVGVADDHDLRVPVLPLTGRDEPFNHASELGGGDRGRVRTQHRVHQLEQLVAPCGRALVELSPEA